MVWRTFDHFVDRIKYLNADPIYWKGEHIQFVKFGLWAAIGTFISAFAIFFYLAAKGYPLEQEVALYFLLGGVMVWFFSRLGHVISLGSKFFDNPKKYLLETGLYNHGGLVAGLLIAWMAVWKLELPWLVALDAFAVGASIGLCFGRIGCYVYGCCWGRETHDDYGISYQNKNASVLRIKPYLKGKKLYPTQLMTAFINLLLFTLAMVFLYIDTADGFIFLAFVTGHQGARLWLEYYRDDMNFDEGRNYTTVFAAGIMMTLGISLIGLSYADVICLGCDHASLPRHDLLESMMSSLTNVNIWKGATTITIIMGTLLGVHGKELGSW